MASNQWKVFEREVARDLGGERTGPTGKDSPDVINLPIPFAPECKYMQRLSLKTDHLRQAKANAKGQDWGLFIREAKSGRRVVVLEYKTFLKFWKHHVKYEEQYQDYLGA